MRALRVLTVLLAVVAATVLLLAALRADRLQDEGIATTATVVAQDARGKSWLAVLSYADADGREREAELRIGRWVDPYGGYAVGDRVPVRHDPDDPSDLRTARDWNTPAGLWATGVVAGLTALVGALVLVAQSLTGARSTRWRGTGQPRGKVPSSSTR